MNFFRLHKNTILWCLFGFFALSAIVFLPSLSSLFSVLVAALILPLAKWQALLGRIKKPIKAILLTVLIILTFMTAPATSDDNTSLSSNQASSDSTNITNGDNHNPSEENPSTTPEHVHSYQEATCTQPRTCTACGQTQGDPLDHTWVSATCTTAKTCSSCDTTEGTAAEHQWTNATCTSAKKCSICGETEGAAAEHQWVSATCTSPKTCSVCKQTSGSIIDHTYKNGTCSVCGKKAPSSSSGGTGSGSSGNSGSNTSGSSNSGASGDPDNDDTNGTIVYRTPTGSRYHLDPDCGGKNSTQTTLSKALNAGLTPCKTCAQ